MLELIDLTKQYGSSTAIDHISLNVEDGEIFGLLGPNGAGKSTLVSMISTVKVPSGGEIKVKNKSLSKFPMDAKKVMGIVPQDIALYEALSAKENLELFGCLYGLSRNEIKRRVKEVLDIIELDDRKDQAVEEFSGGMKRRVNIGVALMNHPELLILDEPTVGIDPQSRNHILETVRRLNKEKGMTVIYASHYMEEVEFLCSRVAIVDNGKLIALGTKEELKDKMSACDTLTVSFQHAPEGVLPLISAIEGVERAEIGSNKIIMLIHPAVKNVMDIIDRLRSIEIHITGFKFEEVNLESIFLQITGKSLRE